MTMGSIIDTHSERAWIVKEHLAGRTQTEIANELGVSSPVICTAIKSFCDHWSGADVQRLMAYNDARRKYALKALQNYFVNTGVNPQKPEMPNPMDRDFLHARSEHAWMLRAEGLPYRQIATRIGLTPGRSREIVFSFGRVVTKSLRRATLRFGGIA